MKSWLQNLSFDGTLGTMAPGSPTSIAVKPQSILKHLFVSPIELIYSLCLIDKSEGRCILYAFCSILHVVDLGDHIFDPGKLQQRCLI